MSLISCPACGHQVAASATTCPSCGGKLSPPGANAGCLGIIIIAILVLLVAWACSKLNPPPKNPSEALTKAGYTQVEHALSRMDCREDEIRVRNFSAFKAGEFVFGIVCERKGGGKSYRIQSRSWNEHVDGPPRKSNDA